MTKDQWMIFYVVYGISAFLMLVVLIRGLVKRDPMKKIGRELVRPLGMIIGSLIIWYVYISVATDIAIKFKF